MNNRRWLMRRALRIVSFPKSLIPPGTNKRIKIHDIGRIKIIVFDQLLQGYKKGERKGIEWAQEIRDIVTACGKVNDMQIRAEVDFKRPQSSPSSPAPTLASFILMIKKRQNSKKNIQKR